VGKSVNGPDMQDCLLQLTAMQESARCTITLLLEPDGCGAGPRWQLHALAVGEPAPNPEQVWTSAARCYWPSRYHKTFEGALFKLLCDLDVVLTQSTMFRVLELPA